MNPPNEPASRLWQKLQQSPWPSDVMDYPRNGVEEKIRIRVLSLEEQDKARYKALKKVKRDLGVSDVVTSAPEAYVNSDLQLAVVQEGVYSDAVAKEVLALCCLEPEPIDPDKAVPVYPRVFTDGAMVGQLPPDEVRALFTAFELVQQKYSPSPRDIASEAQLNAWIKTLAEGASAYPLARVPLLQLVELVMSLAGRAYALSAILESQFSTLPDTLKSDLESCSIGTGYFGAQPSTDGSSTTEIFGSGPNDSIDIEDAVEVAKRMGQE